MFESVLESGWFWIWGAYGLRFSFPSIAMILGPELKAIAPQLISAMTDGAQQPGLVWTDYSIHQKSPSKQNLDTSKY